ncbi:major facilitator superfamily domain-containing protein [Dioszegia hungarica]|uniref:Major facilitator superfamily domain-containing protein n=1 Tax=Dioszegia hungarica TaxID=4972 RepID=A0AA38LSD4_9TREE|nr:major facilitator superfamily domain-containing protein [Dioszegia hungarica]KAI9635727.1 major facilitator superfamily domain-containing protein [Dioszegia hungarica]
MSSAGGQSSRPIISEASSPSHPAIHPYTQPTRRSAEYSGKGQSSAVFLDDDGPTSTRASAVPYVKIFPLCLSRVAEGMIFAVILPYINEMIRGFGVEEKKVGVYSAMAESALMISEAISAPLFAPLADSYGRRPVFLICVFLWGAGAVSFGFVGSVMAAVVCRGFLGLLAGAGVLSRTMVGELCDKSNRIQGFAIFSPSLTVGVTLGPVIGGFLSNPVPRFLPPSFTLLTSYPYLLPSLVAGTTGFAAWATSYIYLPETLPPSLRRSERDLEKTSKPGVGQLLRHRPFQNVLILYGLTNAVQFTFEAIYPLFAFTRKDLGGLELPTDTIGVVLGFSAALSIFMTISLFPVLHRAIPEDIYLVLCLLCYPLATIFFPLIWASHNSAAPHAGLGWGTIGLMSMQMLIRRVGDFSCTLLDTIIFETIPSPSLLVVANSLTFSIGAIGRAIGPFIISYFFSISTHFASDHPARQAVWVIFALLGLPGAWLAWNMRNGTGGSGSGSAGKGYGEEEERVELMARDRVAEEVRI